MEYSQDIGLLGLGATGRIYWDTDAEPLKPKMLVYNKAVSEWPAILAHELGHVLLNLLKPDLQRRSLHRNILFQPHETRVCEVLAWRLAKSFLDPRLWDEKLAIGRLASYFEGYLFRQEKVCIIEYNNGKEKD